MLERKFLFAGVLLALPWTLFSANMAPSLQWVTTTGGSGSSSVTASAIDSQGNLYIVGSTTSLDFAAAHGATLVSSTTDAFAVKLDNRGNLVYATRFGGAANDSASAVAVGYDGSLYVAGSTDSQDFPATAGTYLTKLPATPSGNAGFLIKLNPAGAVAWATYFPEAGIEAIAVDHDGNPFIGGSTAGGLPTTTGAYVTTFQQSVTSNGFFSIIGPMSAFVTKFNAAGSNLVYSTYVPTDNNKNTVQSARALVVDSGGNTWIGVTANSNIAPTSGTSPSVVELNSTGSAVLASAVAAGMGNVSALALDSSSNVYIAGSYAPQAAAFPATAGAFQSVPQPVDPTTIPYGPSDAFVAKWDSSLTHLLAATLLGGEGLDGATSVAVDGSGNVIVGGFTGSSAFPTRAPFQESFASPSGFVAAFDPNLSSLLFSTYLGDGRTFTPFGAFPDGNGNIVLAGATQGPRVVIVTGGLGPGDSVGGVIIANKIALAPAPAMRLDSVQNYASHLARPITPGEPILALGQGFSNTAHIILDGVPLTTLSATATSLVAYVPDEALPTPFVHTVQVAGGTVSNSLFAPGATASPALYTVGGSGVGQVYVVNSDGTMNSAANPAAGGSKVTIYMTGEGPYSVTNGYAVAEQTPAVFIDGFYCNGIAAVVSPVNGLPGNVYQLSVFVPAAADIEKAYPDLKSFQFPPQSTLQVAVGAMVSQPGVFINVK